jgi:alpha-tubulin suppressor-like RCC1 family protein
MAVGMCAVTADGALDCWGSIYALVDELLFGGNSTTPTPRFELADVAQAALGTQGGCFTTTDGAASCWGPAAYGNLGNGKTGNGGTAEDSATPVAVSGLTSGVQQVTVGGGAGYGSGFGCAITDTGGIRCWGFGLLGQLGNGDDANSSTPVAVTGIG